MSSTNGETPDRGKRFGETIRAAREAKGWTQDELVAQSEVSRATLLRWEAGNAHNPDPAKVRRVFVTLGLNPREAPVLLGFVTREEMELGPTPPRIFDRTTEEVIEILEDPNVPEVEKREWARFLRFRTGREETPGRRRSAG